MDKRINRMSKNFGYNLLYQIIAIVTPLFTAPYVSRVLGVKVIGVYSYTQSIIAYFLLAATMGTGVHARRVIASTDDRQKQTTCFIEILLLRIILMLVSVAGLVVLIAIRQNYRVLLMLGIIDVIATTLDIAWLYQGLENFRITATRQIIIKTFACISIFVFVKSPNDIYIYALCNSIPGLFGSIVLWKNLSSVLCKVKITKLHLISHLKMSFMLFVPVMANVLYSYLDKTMLGSIVSGKAESGYYEQATKFIYLGVSVVTSLSAVVMPRIAKAYGKGDINEIKQFASNGGILVSVLSFGIAGTLFSISDNLIPWFYGVGYERVILLVKFLCFVLAFKGINDFIGTAILIPTYGQTEYGISVWGTTLLNAILNFLLIKRYGAAGACLASAVSEIILCILLIYLGREYVGIKRWKEVLLKIVVPFAGFAVLINRITRDWASGVLETVAISLIYLLVVGGAFGIFYMPMLIVLVGKMEK